MKTIHVFSVTCLHKTESFWCSDNNDSVKDALVMSSGNFGQSVGKMCVQH